MKKLSKDQRRALAEFSGNFAVAWLATGIIVPFITGGITIEGVKGAVLSLIWTGVLLKIMLSLLEGGRK